MSAPRKFDEETRARAVRLYTDRVRDHGESKLTARKHVGQLLDINPATLRNWIEADAHAAHSTGGAATSSGDDAANCGGCVKRTPSCGGPTRSSRLRVHFSPRRSSSVDSSKA